MIRQLTVSRQEMGGRADYFSLFVNIDSYLWRTELRGLSESNLDEHELLVIHHDEVDLSATTLKVLSDQAEPMVEQEPVRVSLSPIS